MKTPKVEIPKINFDDTGPLFTTIPALGDFLLTAKVRAAFMVVQDETDDNKVRVIATNNDARFQPPLAFALMAYLEAYFDETGDREALTRSGHRKSARRR